MIAPRNAKELAKVLANDTELRRRIHRVVADADLAVEDGVLEAVKAALRRGQISLQVMSHADVTNGLKRYYQDIRAASKFVKMW